MDAKLKEKIKEFAQAGLLQWKKSHKPAPIGAQPEPIDSDIKSKALTAWLVRFVRNRLTKEGLWTKVQKALVHEALLLEMDRYTKKAQPRQPRRPPVDERQSVFPGFEIPEKIGSGKRAIKLPEARMSKFLAFVDGFQARSQRDYKRGEDLRRLAEKLRPFTEGDPTVADAFARASAQPVVLEIVKAR